MVNKSFSYSLQNKKELSRRSKYCQYIFNATLGKFSATEILKRSKKFTNYMGDLQYSKIYSSEKLTILILNGDHRKNSRFLENDFGY